MSIPELESKLPQERGPLHAFDVVNELHFASTQSFEAWERLAPLKKRAIILDYFDAALSYLANGTQDPYLEELGTTAWVALRANHITCGVGSTTHAALETVGLSDFKEIISPTALSFCINPGINEESMELVQEGFLIIPQQFVFTARENPLAAFDQVVDALSLARDFLNTRAFGSQEHINERILASKVSFILTAQREHPELSLGPVGEMLVAKYPQGVQSLPPKVGYKGTYLQRFGQR